MKKLLFVFTAILLFSCSSDNNSQSTNSIKPPQWIIGTWLSQEDLDLGITTGVKFTSNNFCTLLMQSSFCLNEFIEVQQTVSDTDYEFSIGDSTLSTAYHFKKFGNNKIQVINKSGIVVNIFTKQ